MKRENQILKSDQSSWQNERQQLMEKNQLTKSKLQSVLDRLKAIDNS
jgi:cell division protein ZapB